MSSKPLNDDEVVSEMNKMVRECYSRAGIVEAERPLESGFDRSRSSGRRRWRKRGRLESRQMKSLRLRRCVYIVGFWFTLPAVDESGTRAG